jgi:hypothetical protein
VSSKPLVGSAIDGLIYDSIQVGAQPIGVHPGCAACGIRNYCARYEPAWRKRAELRDRYPVSTDDDDLSGLHVAKDGAGVVAQLALGDGSRHGKAM